MIAYKGFTGELTARLGEGIYQFREGDTFTESSSKTAESGFHCCENPFRCLTYYPLGNGNRYFMVKAEGSIDEDESERIACTRLTLLKELTLKEFAGHGMMYMVQHPAREKWQQSGHGLEVCSERATADCTGAIAIARGAHPEVRGAAGSILGLILEPAAGNIVAARLFVAGENRKADTWYTLTEEGEIKEAENETEET